MYLNPGQLITQRTPLSGSRRRPLSGLGQLTLLESYVSYDDAWFLALPKPTSIYSPTAEAMALARIYTPDVGSELMPRQVRDQIVSRIPAHLQYNAKKLGWWPIFPIVNDLVQFGNVQDPFATVSGQFLSGEQKELWRNMPKPPWYKGVYQGVQEEWSSMYWGKKRVVWGEAQFWWGRPDGEISIKDVVPISRGKDYYIVNGGGFQDRAQFMGETFRPAIFPSILWERRGLCQRDPMNQFFQTCKWAESGDLRIVFQPRTEGFYEIDPAWIHSFPAPRVMKSGHTLTATYVPTNEDIAAWLKRWNEDPNHTKDWNKMPAIIEIVNGKRIITIFGVMREPPEPGKLAETLSKITSWGGVLTNLLPGIGPAISALSLTATINAFTEGQQSEDQILAWIEGAGVFSEQSAGQISLEDKIAFDNWLDANRAEVESVGLSVEVLKNIPFVDAQLALKEAFTARDETKRKNTIVWGSVGAVGLAGTLGYFLMKKKKKKRRS